VDDVSPGALAPTSTGPTGRGLAGAAGPVAGDLLARERFLAAAWLGS
jgi:hypothetical protein